MTYRGKAATWAYGRQLTSYDGNTFSYDARGRRISKNNITFTYDSNGNLIKQSNGLEFLYDHTGVFAVKYAGSTYFYRKNAQNDIIALLDNTGTVVVKYKYDAWGNCKVLNDGGVEIPDSDNIGILNPFRYRSYYYDTETDLYFLKTRYYDPEIGRFTTIDDISYLDSESINGLNLYAYCLNNPIMYIDFTGCSIIATLIFIGVTAIIGGIIGGVSSYQNGDRGWEVVKNVLIGFTFGAAIGGAIVSTWAVFAGAIGGASASVLGAPALQAFAVGSLAVNSLSIFGVLFGVETEPIEYDPTSPYMPTQNIPYSHPTLK